MCTGCGEMFDKRELVRVVKSPEGEVSLDLTGKKAGRAGLMTPTAYLPAMGDRPTMAQHNQVAAKGFIKSILRR